MKKFFSILLILIFAVSTVSYASAGRANETSKAKKIISKTGTVCISNNIIELKTSTYKIILTGQRKELAKYKNKVVKVNGYMNNNRFVVKNVSLIKKLVSKDTKSVVVPKLKSKPKSPQPKPTTAPIKEPILDSSKTTTIYGVVSANNIEGLHYELNGKEGIYVLVGYDKNELAKFVGKTVKIAGKIQENQISIYQRGILFSVASIEENLEATAQVGTSDKQQLKIHELTGTVVINKIKGANIGLQLVDIVYNLIGNTEGIEKLDGKKVKIIGFFPDIRYIRAPDYVMFEVQSYEEVK